MQAFAADGDAADADDADDAADADDGPPASPTASDGMAAGPSCSVEASPASDGCPLERAELSVSASAAKTGGDAVAALPGAFDRAGAEPAQAESASGARNDRPATCLDERRFIGRAHGSLRRSHFVNSAQRRRRSPGSRGRRHRGTNAAREADRHPRVGDRARERGRRATTTVAPLPRNGEHVAAAAPLLRMGLLRAG